MERQPSDIEAAQKKSYVTYTLPRRGNFEKEPSAVTILECRALLSASGTTGFRTWDAALHLGAYLCSAGAEYILRGKKVLELGAGTGFLSILCCKYLGAQYVLATDGDAGVVESIETNMFINELDGTEKIEAKVLKWGHALFQDSLTFHDEPVLFDVVLAADVVRRSLPTSQTMTIMLTRAECEQVYDVQAVSFLMSTIRDLFAINPDLYLLISISPRNETTFGVFEKACGSYLSAIDHLASGMFLELTWNRSKSLPANPDLFPIVANGEASWFLPF